MNDWQKTVAKFTKLHKGKSLTEILPLAKAEYRKTHKVGKIAKKPRKTRGHKKKQHGGEDPVPANNGDFSENIFSNGGSSTSPQQDGGKRRKRRTKKSRKGKKAKKSHSRRRH